MATPNIIANVPAPAGNYNPVVKKNPGDIGAGTYSYIPLVESWPDPLRSFENLQSMPNAYVGAAREGVYCPFRLSETC